MTYLSLLLDPVLRTDYISLDKSVVTYARKVYFQSITHIIQIFIVFYIYLINVTAVEMKYMRRTAGYNWKDYKTNTQITKGIKNKVKFWTNCWNTRETGYNM